DTSNQALLLLGGRRAAREADETHPFGYGRERYFWAFVVALVLFSMGGLFALYEGIEKLRHPHATESLAIAIGILIVAIILETFSLRTAVREAKHVKPDDISWWKFIRTSKSPELPVVLLEDVGAEIGLFLALIGVSLAAATGDPRWDAVGSIAIGLLLVAIGIVLAIETKGLLLGESASQDVLGAIAGAIEGQAEVKSLIHCRTQHIGPDELLVGAKVEFDRSLTFAELASAVDKVEAAIRRVVPNEVTIYVEPDLRRAAGGE
ncbi:MAG TPA: cation diffusion facilitator family transporter, partial [Acidimicrobiia bacterium]|nr:cation diffusion facilitator family transporter [Acidimicrobiia bacterium]